MKKNIAVLILFLILLTLAPVITASNREDIARLEAVGINPDFSELSQLKGEIIKLYQIDTEGNQFADFTPTCMDFIRASDDTYSKIRALNENSAGEDVNNINSDALSENYTKFCVDASDYKVNLSFARQIENITDASRKVMERINSSFEEKVKEMKGIKKRLELSLGESRAEILALQDDYTTLQNYSSLLAMRQELENTSFVYTNKLRNSMIISFVIFMIVGVLSGILISWMWKRRVEYLSVYTRKAKLMHPVVYASAITIVVVLLMLVYVYMKDALDIFSYLIP